MINIIKDIIRILRVLVLRRHGAQPLDISDWQNVVIFAPHPDDEIIGCGGLVASLAASGIAPHVIIMSGGGGSHHGCCNIDVATLIRERRKLTLKAADIVGMPHTNIHFLDFTDGGILEEETKNMERLQEVVAELKPKVLLVPHSGEGWSDHIATRRIGMAMAAQGTEVWEYCVWMWYYNVWKLDWSIAKQLSMTADCHRRKLAAMDAYTQTTAPCGNPWSGVLPRVFLWANRWNREMYFKKRF